MTLSSRRVTAIAVLAAAVSFGLYLSGLTAVCTDCISRAFWASAWWHDPDLQHPLVWLPLHSLLFGLPVYWSGRVLGAIHLLNSLSAGATVWLGARLAWKVSGSSRAEWLTAILIATSPLHARFGVSMLSEPFFNVLTLAFLLSVIEWLRTSRRIWLYAAGGSVLLMSMDRWFGWPVAGLFGAWIVLRERKLGFVAVALACWAFPILWMAVNAIHWGDPFFPIRIQGADSQMFYAGGGQRSALGWELFRAFAAPGAMTFLIVWPGRHRGWPRVLAAWAFVALLLEGWMVWNHVPTVFPLRSFTVSGLLFLIGAGVFLGGVQERGKSAAKWLPVFAAALIGYQTAAISYYRGNLDAEAMRIGERLRKSAVWNEEADRGFTAIGLEPLRAMQVAVAADRPDRFVQVRYDESNGVWVGEKKGGNAPRMVLVGSEREARALLAIWRASVIPLEGIYLVSDIDPLIRDLSR
jgi:hypothetical protein